MCTLCPPLLDKVTMHAIPLYSGVKNYVFYFKIGPIGNY